MSPSDFQPSDVYMVGLEFLTDFQTILWQLVLETVLDEEEQLMDF